MAEKNKRRKGSPEEWTPPVGLRYLYKGWLAVFGLIKIALGAVATVLLVAVVCAFVVAGLLSTYLETDILPNADLILEDYDMDEPSYVYNVNEDGEIEILQKIHAVTAWKNADYEDIPQDLIHATVAIEDKRFYEHQGVDWITTIKAFANMFLGDETVGGSSITQQLIKNITQKDSVTIQRKVQEFFSATLVEKNYDKDTIMELYLNSIYLGQGCRGVRSAAETYFGKELQTLTTAECAALISITNNPSLFDPYSENTFMYQGELMNGKERNRHRQVNVLWSMKEQGWITEEEYQTALAQEIILKNGVSEEDKWIECSNEACTYENVASTYTKSENLWLCPKCNTGTELVSDASQGVYSYFVDAVIEQVTRQMAIDAGVTEWNDEIFKYYYTLLGRRGYHIYTTMDKKVQDQVDKIYQDLDNIPKTRSAQQIQSAITVVDVRTGDIVAMAGGVGTEKAPFGFNRAVHSKLQSGSSIKPLAIYAPGFEQGTISPATVIKDMPLNYSDGAWPRNDNRTYSYTRTIFSGIVSSVNAIAANTLNKIGEDYGYEFLRDSFGLTTLTEEDRNFASLALGAQDYGVSVSEMASAFATFANSGVYREGRLYTKVYDRDGNIVYDNEQDSRAILGEKAVTYTNYCLTNAVSSGTGGGAYFYGTQVAGKTGTTSSSRDRWFCGYTNYYAAAVWVGYDQPEVISLSYNPAARLWKQVMEPIHKGLQYASLYSTSKMVSVSVCLDSGLLATDACKADVRAGEGFSRVETVACYPEDKPTKACTKHVLVDSCSSGGVSTEFCQKFAEVDENVKIEKKGLLKLTESELYEIQRAVPYGLKAEYTRDDYIYLTDDNGEDANFRGVKNTANKNLYVPYLVCTEHTRETWAQYEAQHPATPETPDSSTSAGGNNTSTGGTTTTP